MQKEPCVNVNIYVIIIVSLMVVLMVMVCCRVDLGSILDINAYGGHGPTGSAHLNITVFVDVVLVFIACYVNMRHLCI